MVMKGTSLTAQGNAVSLIDFDRIFTVFHQIILPLSFCKINFLIIKTKENYVRNME